MKRTTPPSERVLGEQSNIRAVLFSGRIGHVIVVNRRSPSRITEIRTDDGAITYETRDGWAVTIPEQGDPYVEENNRTVEWARLLNPNDSLRSDTIAADILESEEEDS